jgi:hypothetical protein
VSDLPPTSGPVTLAADDEPVDSSVSWFYHQTTLREPYEYRHRRHPDVDEVVMINERGELTETTRANLGLDAGGRVPGARTGQAARLAVAGPTGRWAPGRPGTERPAEARPAGRGGGRNRCPVSAVGETDRSHRWAPARLAAEPAVGVVCGRSTSSRITAPSITGRSVASIHAAARVSLGCSRPGRARRRRRRGGSRSPRPRPARPRYPGRRTRLTAVAGQATARLRPRAAGGPTQDPFRQAKDQAK